MPPKPDQPKHQSPARGRRWFAFLGGAIAWFVHLAGVYLISEFGCVSGLAGSRWQGISAVAWLLIAVSLALLAVATAATIVGFVDTRRAAPRDREPHDYLSRAGWLFSLLFAIIIAFEAVPALYYLRGC